MGREPEVLVVVPAWNEQACIAETLTAIRTAAPEVDVVVVDDGSIDRTGEFVRNAGVRVLTLPFNLGVGAAMRTGFRYAETHGYDVVVQIDADGQHDPADLPALLGALNVDGASGCAVVVGARQRGPETSRQPWARRLAMRLLAASLSRSTGTQLSDVTCGYRAANRTAIALFARHYPAEYLGDTVESLVIAHRCGLRIGQVPVGAHPRRGGRPSQHGVGASLYLARALLILLLARIRRWPALPPAPRPAEAA